MITIREGFLILTAADGGRSEYVKASRISRVIRISKSGPVDPRTAAATMVTIGDNGWSIEVRESPEDIIDAIGTANRVHP
jgi:hypothetical protein